MVKGYVALVLHAHLPYVRHPEHENQFEERWLFEAISETYIPLLCCFESLISEGIDFRINMSITPSLLTMLTDPLLQERYIMYLEKQLELTRKEIVRTEDQPEFNRLARMYNAKYKHDFKVFNAKYHRNLAAAFKKLQDSGYLEIMACAATHGFLPAMAATPQALQAQISAGVNSYKKYFDCDPRGVWLPECGYVAEAEPALKENGIEYFITESHGVLYANPRPVFGTYKPIVTPEGLVVFGRDMESSKQVWSSAEGYPGDCDYREFYRDIGYDLDYDYIKEFISPLGGRIHTGIKYYRITGKNGRKEPYNPDWAKSKAEIHAGNFLYNREKRIICLNEKMSSPPILVCPYDAELFGHWWYEGPYWLYSLIKKVYMEQDTFKLITLSEYLKENPVMQLARPCPSTWGYKGYNEVWLNTTNDWIYKYLFKSAFMMMELANEYNNSSGIIERALNQSARELLLAQSSDWAFIMKTGTMVQYAEKRTKDHLSRFTKLYHDIKDGNIDVEWLRDIESKDNIFPEIDFRVYKNITEPIKNGCAVN